MIIYAVLQGYTQQDDYYTGHRVTRTLTFAEPTWNSSSSAVALAPSDPDAAPIIVLPKAGGTEKLSLNPSLLSAHQV